MSKELFQKVTLTLAEKFYVLMDLLLSNQNPSRMECIIFLGISYIHIISGFFAEQIECFEKKSKSDKILYYFQQILRFKDLFIDKYSEFKILIFSFFKINIIKMSKEFALFHKDILTFVDIFYLLMDLLL